MNYSFCTKTLFPLLINFYSVYFYEEEELNEIVFLASCTKHFIFDFISCIENFKNMKYIGPGGGVWHKEVSSASSARRVVKAALNRLLKDRYSYPCRRETSPRASSAPWRKHHSQNSSHPNGKHGAAVLPAGHPHRQAGTKSKDNKPPSGHSNAANSSPEQPDSSFFQLNNLVSRQPPPLELTSCTHLLQAARD